MKKSKARLRQIREPFCVKSRISLSETASILDEVVPMSLAASTGRTASTKSLNESVSMSPIICGGLTETASIKVSQCFGND